MSFEVTIICDNCNIVGAGATTRKLAFAEVRRDIGWIKKVIDGRTLHFCDRCKSHVVKHNPRTTTPSHEVPR